jgi:hypothetical protein
LPRPPPAREPALHKKEQDVEDHGHPDGEDRDYQDVRLEGDVRAGDDQASQPPTARKVGEGRDRNRRDRRDPKAGHDLGNGEWKLDLPQELATGHAHPPPRVLGPDRHVVEARDDVAVDDLDVVGGERDQRGIDSATGDRQEQEEERDARDRVEDTRGPDERRHKPALPVGEDRHAHRDHEAENHGEAHEVEVLERRRDVALREVLGDPVEAERPVVLDALVIRVAGKLLGEGLADDGDAHAPSGRSAAECSSSVASAELRKSPTISIERTPVILPEPSTTGA